MRIIIVKLICQVVFFHLGACAFCSSRPIYLTLLYLISKEEIYTSKVKYFVKKGKLFIWIPEKDFHNVVQIVLSIYS